ncbi:hypothetical protein HRbin34_00360 [bacterium HR34]|nr:hypothetical protein HRbin34_00360 [bacterium HR34]
MVRTYNFLNRQGHVDFLILLLIILAFVIGLFAFTVKVSNDMKKVENISQQKYEKYINKNNEEE